MRKALLLTLMLGLISSLAFSQTDKFWSANNKSRNSIATDKAVARLSYPKEFKLFNLDIETLKQELFAVVGNSPSKFSAIISLPDADGKYEQFEVFEASNFEPDLQAQFPDIRAYSGRGITDKYATLKLSISPQGIQTMVFRTDKPNEFIEPYSKDHNVYSVFKSNRDKGKLQWSCTTEEKQMVTDLNTEVFTIAAAGSSTGQLKTMRLAQSCNGEYANFFGATSNAQVSLVLAAYNATLTRCNGCYEKDLALHLNLIANTTAVIYYNPSTDPYSTTLSQWNAQLQSTLTSVIGEANYDIGHMFGASGGGGNAGCIGCVCVNGSKGSGITSPADGIPQGDNFDIDYVAHEVGHQLGGNHTFSMSLEGTGVNKEVGSGITIMGYAGITAQDVAPHSIDIFHEATIAQIQANLAAKTCPVSVAMTANHAPVLAAVNNYTIPISTPFALTGTATDAENDPLTYCWEQNDNSTVSGASSVASPTKATGPNWLSFPATVTGTRPFPKLSTILSGLNVTPPLPGGDAGANIEALSSVSRTLNFRVTVRDNNPYVAGSKIGQTAFTDAVVTVTNTSGPFAVTAPNTPVTWSAGSAATVTWSVNGTTGAPVSCASVNILLSTDGGNTFSTVLASGTANDGSEIIIVPATSSTTCRVKVAAVGNIFFDISNTNFTIGAPAACGDASGLTASSVTQTSATVSWTAVSGAINYAVDYKTNASSTWINAATATTATSVNLSALTAGTLYDWRVRASCSGGSGNYVQSQFTTATPPVTCPGIYDVSTNGTTGGAALIPLNTDVKGLINVSGDNDYYRFTITTGGTITLSLTTLPANYQLALLNSSGTTLQSSTSGGTNNETINRTVTAGTYYARVYPRNNNAFNASNCYTLRVQTGTATRNTGVETVQFNNDKFSVFPNPVGYTAGLSFTAAANGKVNVTVTNQLGGVVLSKIMAVNEGNNIRSLDVSALAIGMYFIRIQNGADIQMAKLVISK
jgi:Metallo-peptidase family M12B Reprolysin-like/Bacterial pre-peptidase C-terminal domain/Secretion system C-terminal sorting domain/Fibronectin type III domain